MNENKTTNIYEKIIFVLGICLFIITLLVFFSPIYEGNQYGINWVENIAPWHVVYFDNIYQVINIYSIPLAAFSIILPALGAVLSTALLVYPNIFKSKIKVFKIVTYVILIISLILLFVMIFYHVEIIKDFDKVNVIVEYN